MHCSNERLGESSGVPQPKTHLPVLPEVIVSRDLSSNSRARSSSPISWQTTPRLPRTTARPTRSLGDVVTVFPFVGDCRSCSSCSSCSKCCRQSWNARHGIASMNRELFHVSANSTSSRTVPRRTIVLRNLFCQARSSVPNTIAQCSAPSHLEPASRSTHFCKFAKRNPCPLMSVTKCCPLHVKYPQLRSNFLVLLKFPGSVVGIPKNTAS